MDKTGRLKIILGRDELERYGWQRMIRGFDEEGQEKLNSLNLGVKVEAIAEINRCPLGVRSRCPAGRALVGALTGGVA